jgi:L-threonylcarbamoyladenylate synthase
MRPKLRRMSNESLTTTDSEVRAAARMLHHGGIVAYPTEAVFGLGVDPRNLRALERLLTLKERPPEKGLIVIAASVEQLEPYLVPLSKELEARVFPTWPGPFTWLLPVRPEVPTLLRGVHTTLAVRVTAHPTASALCNAFGGAIVSTSANISTQPPARDAGQVRALFGRRVDAIIDAPVGGADKPTEIRDGVTGALVRPA